MITQQNAETPIGEIPMGRLFAPTLFRWASATATGRLHEVNGEASQDAHALHQFDDPSGNRWLVAAVADGAGSALHGGTGAQIAASAFIEAIAHLIAEGKMDDFNIGLKAAVTFARLELDIVALIAGHDVSHYATTLLGVVTDGNRIGIVQVGDGAVVVGPPWRVVHTPDARRIRQRDDVSDGGGMVCFHQDRDRHPALASCPTDDRWRQRLQIPGHRGHPFRRIADSVPVIADSF